MQVGAPVCSSFAGGQDLIYFGPCWSPGPVWKVVDINQYLLGHRICKQFAFCLYCGYLQPVREIAGVN